jgi:hypothetical protein
MTQDRSDQTGYEFQNASKEVDAYFGRSSSTFSEKEETGLHVLNAEHRLPSRRFRSLARTKCSHHN